MSGFSPHRFEFSQSPVRMGFVAFGVAVGCLLSECCVLPRRHSTSAAAAAAASFVCQSIFGSPIVGCYRLLQLPIDGVVVFWLLLYYWLPSLLSAVTFHCSLSVSIDASASCGYRQTTFIKQCKQLLASLCLSVSVSILETPVGWIFMFY